MKLVLVLCLVAPLAVFGGVVPYDSTDSLNAIGSSDGTMTEEQINCNKNVVQKHKEENPDLAWWFMELEKYTAKLIAKVYECKQLSVEFEKKECMKTVKTMVYGMTVLRDMLPTEKKNVFTKMVAEVNECMKKYA